MDVPYMVRRAARQYAGETAVCDGAAEVTMRELVDGAERFANHLDAAGVPAGAAVGVLSENRIEYPAVDLGISLARRVRVALNARLSLDDFRLALGDCDARVLVHSGRFSEEAAALREELDLHTICLDEQEGGPSEHWSAVLAGADANAVVRAVDEEQPAWISYTSGTTGRAKGVVLSHRALRAVSLNLMLEFGPRRRGESVVLPQPFSHGAGYFLLPFLFGGGGVYMMDRFDPEVAARLGESPRFRTLKLVPAMIPPLLELPGAPSLGFDSIVYGAAPISAPVLDAALERFGPVLMQIYGQSEAPVTLTRLAKEDHLGDGEQRMSAGRPWTSVAAEVRDPDGCCLPPGEIGELTVCGPHHMSGYLGMPEATAEVMRDGWIWTKDMARIDERGFVHLLGRKDEMINSGGFNVSPREVERVLADVDAVAECVVVGVDHPRWGMAINAVVSLHQDGGLTAEALTEIVRPRLTFRTPKRIVFVDQIPRNAYGKADRAAIGALLDGGASRSTQEAAGGEAAGGARAAGASEAAGAADAASLQGSGAT
ncbi:MAG: class I adenylate-forming enzyme family protein [Solirubrobacteraceae bacterium]